MNEINQSIKAARQFEFYVKHIWPIQRVFYKNKISKRCSSCAASEKMIKLLKNNICEICNTYQKNSQPEKIDKDLENTFNQILESHQGKGLNRYDALVLFSGGKDSTYFIKRIKEEFPKLRMLAFTMDNGFMSPVAKSNIDNLLPKLNIDHFFFRPKSEFHKKLFKYTITHLNADGGYGTVDFSDGEFMLDTARHIAAERKIPLILCGYSKYQIQNGLKLDSFESTREKEHQDRLETAGINLKEIFNSEEDLSRWWKASQYKKEDVARLIFPLYAWNLDEEMIKKQVELWGLLQNKNNSPIITNHLLIPLLGVVDVHQLGYSSFEIEFCRMIREGKANKKEWLHVFEFLEYVSMTGLFVKENIKQSLSWLNLDESQVGIKFE